MSPRVSGQPRRRVSLLAVAAGVLATCVMSLAAFRADADRSHARDSEARAQAGGALDVLTAGLQSRVVDVRSLFVSSHSVSRREFTEFTAPMVGRGHANGLNWLEKVDPERRVAAEREFGEPITTLSPDGRLVRDHTPGPVFPIRFAALGEPARTVIGFNAFTRADRRAAITEAIATGRPTSTPVLRLARAKQLGFLLYAPVYRPGGRHVMEDTLGIVAGSFSVADARVAVQRAVEPGTAVRVQLAGSDVMHLGKVEADAPRTTFTFAGQTWSVQSVAAPQGGLRLGPATLVGGLLLIVVLLLAAFARSSRALAHLGRQDRDRAERRFLDTFASAPIGMALVTTGGQVIRVNPAYEELAGRTEAEILAGTSPTAVQGDDRERATELFAQARQ